MKLASTISPGKGDMHRLLHRFAHELMAQGVVVRGLVQVNSSRSDGRPCDMDVQVLPDGPMLHISQSLGHGSRGCRLDTGALEQAIAEVSASLDGAELLLVNKFGKREAEGGGFREVIGQALAEGIPVLCGTNALNIEAFEEFSGGLAEQLAPDLGAFHAWFSAKDA